MVAPLTENDQYEFRVKAMNSAGVGEPSKPSDVVIIQDEPGRPYIDLSTVKDITVKAGQEFKVNCYSPLQPV